MDKIYHYHTGATRVYMAIMMVAPMAIVMMIMMGSMYPNKKRNAGIIVAGVIVFIMALAALRTQTPIGDVQYMKAMIPHHSSAIMTSKSANIKDPDVRKLADSIIASAGIRQTNSISHLLPFMRQDEPTKIVSSFCPIMTFSIVINYNK